MNASCGAVILAAGASRRMGKPKLVMPWGTTSIIGHLLEVWTQLGAQPVALVCPPPAVAPVLHSELDRVGFSQSDRIINPRPDDGMFSSIRSAAAWDGWPADLAHVVIALGDQPQSSPVLLAQFVSGLAERSESIYQPRYQGRPCHPVALPRYLFRSLRDTRLENLKQFLEVHSERIGYFDIDDPAFRMDIDYPNEYDAALRQVAR